MKVLMIFLYFINYYKESRTLKSRFKDLIITDKDSKYKHSSCVKKNKKNPDCPFLKTKIHCVEDKIFLKVFNSDKTLSKKQEIKPGKTIRFILHLDSIWVYKKSYGINWYIVQAEVKLPNIFHSYVFDNNTSSEIISNHPEYSKFFRMINVGVPKEAVKHKMIHEGLDGDIIFMDPYTLSSTVLKKNKEMLSGGTTTSAYPFNRMSNLSGSIKIQALDLKNVKLKKTIVERKK